jgi:hypothetical protein
VERHSLRCFAHKSRHITDQLSLGEMP